MDKKRFCPCNKYKVKKPIRLIELFAGIGSQAKALKNLDVSFVSYKVVEFDKYAMTSYNAINNTNHEISDIKDTKASDLEIIDTDTFEYIVTYSFPCTDISAVGKLAGMSKGSSTRSGLLWEVERLLNECEELPQVLLMENVPQIHNNRNIDDFNLWIKFLDSKGYSNYWEDLNLKDYGIPQNRKRTFMVSILGNYEYKFPEPFELKTRLGDFIEEVVDNKYLLNQKLMMSYNSEKKIIEKIKFKARQKVHDMDSICETIVTCAGGNTQPKIIQNADFYYKDVAKKPFQIVIRGKRYIIRKLIPLECWRLMGFNDFDFDLAKEALIKIYYNGKDRSNSQLYKQAGNSIGVPVLESIFKQLL